LGHNRKVFEKIYIANFKEYWRVRDCYLFSQELFFQVKNERTGWKGQNGFLTDLEKAKKKGVKTFKFSQRKPDPSRSYLAGNVY